MIIQDNLTIFKENLLIFIGKFNNFKTYFSTAYLPDKIIINLKLIITRHLRGL